MWIVKNPRCATFSPFAISVHPYDGERRSKGLKQKTPQLPPSTCRGKKPTLPSRLLFHSYHSTDTTVAVRVVSSWHTTMYSADRLFRLDNVRMHFNLSSSSSIDVNHSFSTTKPSIKISKRQNFATGDPFYGSSRSVWWGNDINSPQFCN